MGFPTHHTSSQNRATTSLTMMKLVLALTALIVVAQAQPYFGMSNYQKPHFEEENRMDPEMAALIKAATTQFCKDVANGNNKGAWAYADQALDFQCGPKGTQDLCDEVTADKDLGLAA